MGQRKVTEKEVNEARAHAKAQGFATIGGFEYARELPGQRCLYLSKLPNGELIVGVSASVNATTYTQAWVYGDKATEAWHATLGWDGKGEPLGWVSKRGGPPRAAQRVGPDSIDPGSMSNAELLWRFVNGATVGTTLSAVHLAFQQLPGKIPTFTLQDAERVIDRLTQARRRLDFEYFEGRSLKIDLSRRPIKIDLYDRDNGAGAAARALGLDDPETN